MKLYLYSCQDLIVATSEFATLLAGEFYRLEIHKNEFISIYPAFDAGVVILSYDIIQQRKHNQIIFHELNNETMLCEIKPFIYNKNTTQYNIKSASIKLIRNIEATYIYFNNQYYGCFEQEYSEIKFETLKKQEQEYGLISLIGHNKKIILFDNNQMIFCGQYVDNEMLNDFIQIYTHNPNIFNVGRLVKYEFETGALSTKIVCDRGEERHQLNNQFAIIYFLEGLKCGRTKYAYNKLSYELRSDISIDILKQYFKPFDKYIYLHDENVYITLQNNKISGVYHIQIKDNMIDNIY